ncbi:MAG: endonuclease/exonuclease/phosphatase family protein [Thermogemmata sp.]
MKQRFDRRYERSWTYLMRSFQSLPPTAQMVVLLVLLVGLLIAYLLGSRPSASPDGPGPASQGGTATGDILLCLWNFENLFDDQDDARRPVDEEYDNWFARQPDVRQLKYQRLAEVLLRFGGGRGPDIIAGNEVESRRAAELLRDELNRRLPPEAPPYEHIAMLELRAAGRHIAPCLISRFPLRQAQLLGRRQRILEVIATANGHDLVVINSHWTSQLSDKGDDPQRGRGAYASTIAQRCRHWFQQQPRIDLLLCGDFNTTPDDPLLEQQLGVLPYPPPQTDADTPRLVGLLRGKAPDAFGTHFFTGRLADGRHFSGPLIYDQIVVSTGLLDTLAWSCLPETLQVPADGLIRPGSRGRRPWRFGSPGDDPFGRGYSDHLPVLLTLRVQPPP